MEKTVNNLSMRLNLLEQAKIGTDAVADYLLKHPATGSTINKELMKNIGIALSIISALVIALIQGVQK